jgi:nitronate monooxygenase
MDFGAAKAWRDIWGSGQGIGAVAHVPTAGELVARLAREYDDALHALAAEMPALRS